MKHAMRTAGVVAVFLALAGLKPAAQGATLQEELLKDWTANRDELVKIADAMPEEKFGFKSTPAQRSYGEQILHVAGANVMLMKMMGSKATAPAIDMKATSKAAIMTALTDAYDFGIAAIKEQNGQTILETVQGPAFLGPSTRARLVYFGIAHAQDIYGQMAVYLRLNGIVPPASRKSM